MQSIHLVRSYQSIEELGFNRFKEQCYLCTHIIYIFSDYGSHALDRQLFAEEFRFIVLHMLDIIEAPWTRTAGQGKGQGKSSTSSSNQGDPELVGEFLQCLKILQYHSDDDPELRFIVQEAEDFLIRTEKTYTRGMWKNASNSVYDQFHTTYCAAIGLLEYGFSQRAESRLCPPLPRILLHSWWT